MRKLALLCFFLLVPLPLFADAECENQCGIDYWTCSDNCGAFGGALCESQCSDGFNSCIGRCNACPTTRDYTVTTLVSKTASGRNGCFTDFNFNTGAFTYKEYLEKDKRTTYRETTACNGTKTTTVLSTTNETYYCWTKNCVGIGNCCSNPGSPAGLRACAF
jgi:hypothetical protein